MTPDWSKLSLRSTYTEQVFGPRDFTLRNTSDRPSFVDDDHGRKVVEPLESIHVQLLKGTRNTFTLGFGVVIE